MIPNCHLTLCVPEKVEDTGFQKSLWVFVYCNMKLNVIDHLNLNPLKTRNQRWVQHFYNLYALHQYYTNKWSQTQPQLESNQDKRIQSKV